MAGISHQSLPDFFLRLSSLCPSWLPVGSVSQAGLLRFVLFCLFFFNFSVLEAAATSDSNSPASSCWKNAHQTKRGSKNVQLEWPWAQLSESKMPVCSGLWLLPLSARQTQLICSPWVESHTLLLLHTGSRLCMSHTLFCTGCVFAFSLMLPPLACFTPPRVPPKALEEKWKLNTQCTLWRFNPQLQYYWHKVFYVTGVMAHSVDLFICAPMQTEGWH